MNDCFDTVARDLGLDTGSHQGFSGLLYLMLRMLSDLHDGSEDTYLNKYREVLHRLSAYRDTHAYRQIAELFGTRAMDERTV